MRAYQAGFDGNDGFAEENIDDLHPAIPNIDIGGGDRDALVSFMLTLTDERVRYERAPFDHPSLCIPNGHSGDENAVEANLDSPLQAKDEFTCLPAVGFDGLETPQPNFLGLVEPVDDGGDEEDDVDGAETPEAEDDGETAGVNEADDGEEGA